MLTAVKGTYRNGQIILHETPPVQEQTEVIVTFLEKEILQANKPGVIGSPDEQGVRFGSLAGKVGMPADFNDPLDDLSDYM